VGIFKPDGGDAGHRGDLTLTGPGSGSQRTWRLNERRWCLQRDPVERISSTRRSKIRAASGESFDRPSGRVRRSRCSPRVALAADKLRRVPDHPGVRSGLPVTGSAPGLERGGHQPQGLSNRGGGGGPMATIQYGAPDAGHLRRGQNVIPNPLGDLRTYGKRWAQPRPGWAWPRCVVG